MTTYYGQPPQSAESQQSCLYIPSLLFTGAANVDVIGWYDTSLKGTRGQGVWACRWQPQIPAAPEGFRLIIDRAYFIIGIALTSGNFSWEIKVIDGSCPSLYAGDNNENTIACTADLMSGSVQWNNSDFVEGETAQSPELKTIIQAWFNRTDYSEDDWLGLHQNYGDADFPDDLVIVPDYLDGGAENYLPYLYIEYSYTPTTKPPKKHIRWESFTYEIYSKIDSNLEYINYIYSKIYNSDNIYFGLYSKISSKEEYSNIIYSKILNFYEYNYDVKSNIESEFEYNYEFTTKIDSINLLYLLDLLLDFD